MNPRKISPLTEEDFYKKLIDIEMSITHIASDLHQQPLHIYLSLAILGTFAAISFTYLFKDQFFWYLSIIGIVFIIGLMALLFWQRRISKNE
jgi:H+/Cl- antiporter ClcA